MGGLPQSAGADTFLRTSGNGEGTALSERIEQEGRDGVGV